MTPAARRLQWAMVGLVFCLLVNVDGYENHQGYGVGPPNVVALLGRNVRLNCSDELNTTTVPIWRKTPPHGTATNISDREDKYDIIEYSLIIHSVSYNDSGIYTCVVPSSNRTTEVHLTVLGANPTCVIKTSPVENDSVVLTSQLVYSGLVEPEMRWLQLPGRTTTTCADGRCISTIRLTAARQMDGVSAVCRTTLPLSLPLIPRDDDNSTDRHVLAHRRLSDLNHSEHAGYDHSCQVIMSVKYSPSNISIFPTTNGTHLVSFGDTLMCTSQANPPAKYRWRVYTKYGQQVMFQNGANLVIKHPMEEHFLATCTAWNGIRGQHFPVARTAEVKIVYFGVTGIVLGICTGVTLCLLPWLLVFWLFRHEKKMHSEHEHLYSPVSSDSTKQVSHDHENEVSFNKQTDKHKHKMSFCYGNEAYVIDSSNVSGSDQHSAALGIDEDNTPL